MSYTIVIPARYASTRLPGKPLADLAGKSMVQRVWEQASRSGAGRVVVATDDERIVSACEVFGAEVLLTGAAHESGTDRLAEVAWKLALADDAVVVNVQGDEPRIPPAVIDQVAANLSANPSASIATLCEPIARGRELLDPNTVKVVFDEHGMALYFSRAPIPFPRGATVEPDTPLQDLHWRHLGIYAYRAAFLRRFSSWEPAAIERCESLEQLRALYRGERIHVAAACEAVPGGVDTPEDLERLRQLLGGDEADAAG